MVFRDTDHIQFLHPKHQKCLKTICSLLQLQFCSRSFASTADAAISTSPDPFPATGVPNPAYDWRHLPAEYEARPCFLVYSCRRWRELAIDQVFTACLCGVCYVSAFIRTSWSMIALCDSQFTSLAHSQQDPIPPQSSTSIVQWTCGTYSQVTQARKRFLSSASRQSSRLGGEIRH